MEVAQLDIYTDGSSSIRHKCGGWAFVYKIGSTLCWFRGYIGETTNSVAELTAAIRAIELLPDCKTITIFSDSLYVVYSATGIYKRRAHQDLWEYFDIISSDRDIEWRWIKGHNGNPYNTLADHLASYASKHPDISEEFGITRKTISQRGRTVFQPVRIFYQQKDK